MNTLAIFGLQFFLSLVVWGLIAKWLVTPWLKNKSPHDMTFVAGYTNGYIYYSPTAEQLLNVGGAQEDSDCLLAPQWHELYEAKAVELLRDL